MKKTPSTVRAFTFVFAALLVLLITSINSAAAQDQPTLAKDSLQVTAFTFNVYKGNYDVWSWVPKMEFRVNGPIESVSQLYVGYTLPGTGPWVKRPEIFRRLLVEDRMRRARHP